MPNDFFPHDPASGEEFLEMSFQNIQIGAAEGNYLPVNLETSRGTVRARHYPAPGSPWGVVFVGGAGGGWDTPGRGQLYPQLCAELPAEGITTLRVRYRKPAHLEESVLDVLAGIYYLGTTGVGGVALVGHSFGGAVVIQAAATAPDVRSVVALSTQTLGAEPAAELGPRCSLLLVHGTADEILPAVCSETVYEVAQEPKRLELLPGVRHGLDEAAPQVHALVKTWLLEEVTGMRGVA